MPRGLSASSPLYFALHSSIVSAAALAEVPYKHNAATITRLRTIMVSDLLDLPRLQTDTTPNWRDYESRRQKKAPAYWERASCSCVQPGTATLPEPCS